MTPILAAAAAFVASIAAAAAVYIAYRPLVRVARSEIENLWTDLDRDIREAIPPGVWSMSCADTYERIHDLTRLVGPVPEDSILRSVSYVHRISGGGLMAPEALRGRLLTPPAKPKNPAPTG